MTRLVLLGGGGHASDVLGVVEALRDAGEDIEVIGVLADGSVDDRRFATRGVRHLGPISLLAELAAPYVIAVGYPTVRRAIHEQVGHLGCPAATLIHPEAVIGAGSSVGPGAVIFDGAHLSPMSSVGEHSCVSYHANLGHDSTVGGFCTLMPGSSISGNVVVGDDVLIGAHAVVLEQLTVGDGASVGAGATAVRDVPAGAVVVGTPARPLHSGKSDP